ncbi:MAG TPA: cytochrome c oxidase subunit 2A [Paenibacillaceae bacterium]|nr:cytochrome c oxidase subunit 2A [Paenibacillaceae bacterium]
MDKGRKVEKSDSNLRGTFTGVLLIGAFIALVWFSMFYVFISRQ